jgi:hypothetical protein
VTPVERAAYIEALVDRAPALSEMSTERQQLLRAALRPLVDALATPVEAEPETAA